MAPRGLNVTTNVIVYVIIRIVNIKASLFSWALIPCAEQYFASHINYGFYQSRCSADEYICLNADSKSTSVLGLRLLQSYVPLRTDRSGSASASSIYIRSRTLVSTLNHNLH